MQVLNVDATQWRMNLPRWKKNWNDYDFFYLHVKQTDLAGEDGDFRARWRVIEEVDGLTAAPDGAQAGRSHCQRRSLDAGSP